MKMKKIIILLSFIFTIYAYAQEPPSPEEIAKKNEEMRQRIEERKKRDLEILKDTDPEAYDKRLKIINRQDAINTIISSYNNKEISESTARSSLLPLITEEVNEYLVSIDSQIERLNKQIDHLQKIKDNPQDFIEGKIDRYLGKQSEETPLEENIF